MWLELVPNNTILKGAVLTPFKKFLPFIFTKYYHLTLRSLVYVLEVTEYSSHPKECMLTYSPVLL